MKAAPQITLTGLNQEDKTTFIIKNYTANIKYSKVSNNIPKNLFGTECILLYMT